MKKILMLAACTAAMTAITSCSSNDDDVLPQATVAPAAEETVVETSGIPFSVTAFGDTRATLYGAGGIGHVGNDETKATKSITEFKLYATSSAAENWINSWVFKYKKTSTDPDPAVYAWVRDRDNDAQAFGTTNFNWEDTENNSTFYAIAADEIANESGNEIMGVDGNLSYGYITYTIPTKEVGKDETGGSELGNTNEPAVGYKTYDATNQNESIYDGWVAGDWETPIGTFWAVDSTKIKDLMAAKLTHKPTQAKPGIDLEFSHILSGLSVKVKFVSNAMAQADISCIIYGIRIHGLNISGRYNYASGEWSNLNNNKPYYKTFGHGTNKGKLVEATETTPANPVELVGPGEWLFIPQDVSKASPSTVDTEFPSSGAYAEILFYSAYNDDYGVGYIPFKLKDIDPGKNYTLVLNIANMYNTTENKIHFGEDFFGSRLAK